MDVAPRATPAAAIGFVVSQPAPRGRSDQGVAAVSTGPSEKAASSSTLCSRPRWSAQGSEPSIPEKGVSFLIFQIN